MRHIFGRERRRGLQAIPMILGLLALATFPQQGHAQTIAPPPSFVRPLEYDADRADAVARITGQRPRVPFMIVPPAGVLGPGSGEGPGVDWPFEDDEGEVQPAEGEGGGGSGSGGPSDERDPKRKRVQ